MTTQLSDKRKFAQCSNKNQCLADPALCKENWQSEAAFKGDKCTAKPVINVKLFGLEDISCQARIIAYCLCFIAVDVVMQRREWQAVNSKSVSKAGVLPLVLAASQV